MQMRASLVAQFVKNLTAVHETRARFLGQEGPLEREMATDSSIPEFVNLKLGLKNISKLKNRRERMAN